MDFSSLTISSARSALLEGEITACGLVDFYLANIEKKNKDIGAYLGTFDSCRAEAEKIDKDTEVKNNKPLAGIPFAIKDNILVKGEVASAASRMLEKHRAVYDATVIEKLKDAGAIFLGRTNLDEFAMGGSTENSAFGPTKNPHDTSRVAGGSSGGSAAAVAGDLALVALGSDTGGSIRQPASFCGVVGLKPTYGTVSRHGLIAMASSLDQIGPITKNVADAQLVYDIISGKDKYDSTSIDREPETKSLEKKVIGVPWGFLSDGLDEEVRENFENSVKILQNAGFEIREVDLPNVKHALACYYVIMPAEVSSNLARFDGVKYGLKIEGDNLTEDYFKTRAAGFGPEVRRRIMLGTYVLSAGYYDAYYSKAIAVRSLIRQDYEKVFNDGVNVILTPTAPTPSFKIGEKSGDPLQMYLEDIFTVPANLTGMPALAIPSGKTEGGLPLGIQFTAPHFGEDYLFGIGKKFEELKSNE